MLIRLLGLIFARLFSPLVSFVLIVLIARTWGQENLGYYMTALAWLAMFQILSLFGLGEYTAREVGKDPVRAADYTVHGLVIGLVFSLVCMGLMTGAAVFLRYQGEMRDAIMAVSLALPATVCILLCQAVFTAFKRIGYIALASFLENFLLLLSGAFVIFKGYGLMALIWCIVIARSLAAVLNLLLAHRYVVRLHFQIHRGFLWKILSPVVVFGLTGLASQVYLRVDVIMLSKMKDMVTVGLYGSASKLMELSLMLPFAFYILNLPVAAKFYKSFRESAQQKMERYTGELFILIFFIFGSTMLFAEIILNSFYGQSFMEAAWVFRILMLAFLIQSGEIVLGMSCQAAEYQQVVLYIIALRAVINVVLNFILIPVWGMFGAALATLLSAIFAFVIFQIFVNRVLHRFQWISVIGKPALTCLIIMFLLFPFVDRLGIFYLLLMFFCGYGLILFVFNGFSPVRSNPTRLG
ncbi:MAG: flippase [Planctomycetota bacterium]|jgi:O-antigen/teichoic acid export membrane protein